MSMIAFADKNGKSWRICPERLVAILDTSIDMQPGVEGAHVAPSCQVFVDGLTPIDCDVDPAEIEVLFYPPPA